jgi:hypothetical protein
MVNTLGVTQKLPEMKDLISRYSTAFLLLVLVTATATRAQYEDLVPLMWVPLQIGNVWHYNFAGEIEMSISIISGDTLVNDQVWYRLDEIRCAPTPCITHWLHYDDEFRLVSASSPNFPDSSRYDYYHLRNGKSVFLTQTAYDTTGTGCSAIYPLYPDNPDPRANLVLQFSDLEELCKNPDDLSGNSITSFYDSKYLYGIGQYYALVGAIIDGEEWGDTFHIRRAVSIGDEAPGTSDKPQVIRLYNYPNPFNPSTTIVYELDRTFRVNLSILDINGRLVQQVPQGVRNSGRHTWQFNAAGLASGVYTVRLTTGEGPGTQHRIFLLR